MSIPSLQEICLGTVAAYLAHKGSGDGEGEEKGVEVLISLLKSGNGVLEEGAVQILRKVSLLGAVSEGMISGMVCGGAKKITLRQTALGKFSAPFPGGFRLRELDLSTCTGLNSRGVCVGLSELGLEKVVARRSDAGNDFVHSVLHSPHLHHLSVAWCDDVGDAGFEEWKEAEGGKGGKLRVLNLTGTSVSEDLIQYLLEQCPSLCGLSLKLVPSIPCLPTPQHPLLSVDLTGLHFVSSSNLSTFLSNSWHKLASLHLAETQISTKDLLLSSTSPPSPPSPASHLYWRRGGVGEGEGEDVMDVEEEDEEEEDEVGEVVEREVVVRGVERRGLMLRELCLDWCDSVVEDQLLEFVKTCPFLTNVSLRRLEIGDALLFGLAKHCKELKRLNVAKAEGDVSDAGVMEVVKECSSLQRLDLSWCLGISTTTLIHLLTLPNLTHLILEGCKSLHIPTLLPRTPTPPPNKLQLLDLRWVNSASPESTEQLAQLLFYSSIIDYYEVKHKFGRTPAVEGEDGGVGGGGE